MSRTIRRKNTLKTSPFSGWTHEEAREYFGVEDPRRIENGFYRDGLERPKTDDFVVREKCAFSSKDTGRINKKKQNLSRMFLKKTLKEENEND